MPDDLTNDASLNDSNNVNDSPQKFDIGGQTYSQDELNRLVELGKIGLEAETRYNTKIDRVWPEYTKATNEIKNLKAKVDDYESKIQSSHQNSTQSQGETVYSESAKLEALQAARTLGLVTVEDLEKLLDPIMDKKLTTKEIANNILKESRDLETKYNGSDGRPKFITDDVLNYMQESGISKPETAYKVMHEELLDNWRINNISKARRPGLETEERSSAGSKIPRAVKPTDENLNVLIREMLDQDS